MKSLGCLIRETERESERERECVRLIDTASLLTLLAPLALPDRCSLDVL